MAVNELTGGMKVTEAWIIDACRTPRGIGKPGKGALADVHPQHLGSTVLGALAERNQLNTAEVDDVIWGTSAQGGAQAGDIGRMAALDAGYASQSSGVTLDRFCASGLTATNLAATSIMSGMEHVIIAGGSEKMSDPQRMAGRLPTMDQGNLRLRNLHPQTHQGLCADTIATLEGIDRACLDELAARSQQRAAAAISGGYFDRSLVPVFRSDGNLALARDEYPRPGTTAQTLSQLAPSFAGLDQQLDDAGTSYRGLMAMKYPDLEINHVHHAGNSSGVVDGAAAILLSSPQYARANGLRPRARVVAIANMGDCPTLMLNAPVPATRKVLARAGMTLGDIDLFEINEAFAVVAEKFMRDLDLDRDRVNVNGGAIALGHPIGATGAILVGTLMDELERRDLEVGLVTLCAGGGMAPAIIIERL
jgi:acetyl-CoA C-acetyltransferase